MERIRLRSSFRGAARKLTLPHPLHLPFTALGILLAVGLIVGGLLLGDAYSADQQANASIMKKVRVVSAIDCYLVN